MISCTANSSIGSYRVRWIFFGNQAFIVEKKSVRGAELQDTFPFKSPYPLYLVTTRAQRSHAWVAKNLHGLVRDSGLCNYNFLFCYLSSLKLWFPNINLLSEILDKCNILENLFTHVINSNQYTCPKGSKFPAKPHFCFLVSTTSLFLRPLCWGKSNLLFNSLCHSQQFCHECGSGRQPIFISPCPRS